MYAGELFRNDKKYISAKQVSADPLCPQVAVQAWRVRGENEQKSLMLGATFAGVACRSCLLLKLL